MIPCGRTKCKHMCVCGGVGASKKKITTDGDEIESPVSEYDVRDRDVFQGTGYNDSPPPEEHE